MKAHQIHYTSCRRGLSNYAGFQIRSLTPGISVMEQREVEQFSTYRPPRDADPEPDADTIRRTFPVSLRYYALSSGRRALTLSSYSGRDYTGRWGNFFAHTLVFEAEPSGWPIDYLGWKGWKRCLSAAEDTAAEPPPLPAARLDDTVSFFSYQRLQRFLQAAPERVALLARMGRAIFARRTSARALVIRDSPENNVLWMACIQKLFPAAYARSLSYSTYQTSPRGCADVNATSGTTDFTFSETERGFQFYMFDCTNRVYSEVPEPEGDYAAIVAGWMSKDPSRLGSLWAFVDRIDVSGAATATTAAAAAANDGDRDSARDRDSASDRGRDSASDRNDDSATDGGERVLTQALCLYMLEHGLELPARAAIADVVRFALAQGSAPHRHLAVQAWLSLLEQARDGAAVALDTAASVWSELTRASGTDAAAMAETILAAAMWTQSETPVPVPVVGLYFQVLWWCAEQRGVEAPWQQPQVAALIAAAAARQEAIHALATGLFAATPANAEALVAVVAMIMQAAVTTQTERAAHGAGLGVDIGDALGQVLINTSEAVAAQVYRRLDREDTWDVLLGVGMARLRIGTESIMDAYQTYWRSVLAHAPAYARQYAGRMAAATLAELTEPQQGEFAVAFVRSQPCPRAVCELLAQAPADLGARLLGLANQQVSLHKQGRDGDELAERVAAIAQGCQVALTPHRPALRLALRAKRFADIDLAAIQGSLPALDDAEYKRFVADLLGRAVRLTSTSHQHAELLVATLRADPDAQIAFRKAYGKAISQRKLKETQICHALTVWLEMESSHRPLGRLREPVMETLGRAMCHVSENRWQKVKQTVGRDLGASGRRRWRAFAGATDNRRQQPLTQVKRLFARMIGC